MVEEKRQSPRHRTLKAGKIMFGKNTGVFDCTIKNVNETGAMVKLPSTIGIPSRVFLYVESEDQRYPAEVVWRTETEIGLKYTGPAERG